MQTSKRVLPTLLLLVLVSAVAFVSCKKDEAAPVAAETPWSSGSASFARYVAIGNSLTAGFQSNALSSRDQQYSYPNLIAQAIRTTDFQQPLIKEPGIGARKKLLSLTGPVIVDEVGANPIDPASNLNITLARPYNNLGIPGAVTFDMVDRPTNFQAKSASRANPFFALIQRDTVFGRSIVEQARKLQPTFMTCWIGSNDVLGYATSGGSGSPTNAAQFDALYGQLMDSVRAITANAIVANIPDVTSIPFFTTVGPSVRAGLPPGIYLRYQKGANTSVAFDSTRFTESTPPLLLLSGITYASYLGRVGGQGAGKFYSDRGATPPPGIDTTKPFGFHPQNPWPGALTLDADEQANCAAAIAAFNNSIRTKAEAKGFAVVDINGIFRNITRNGFYVPGVGTFSPAFITGGLFSYDGVHPSSRGAAIVANEFIKAINTKYGATIPPVNVASLPPTQGLGYGKVTAQWTEYANIGSFDFYLSLLKR